MNLLCENKSSCKLLVSREKDANGDYEYILVELQVFADIRTAAAKTRILHRFKMPYKADKTCNDTKRT